MQAKDGKGWSDTPRASDLAAICRCEREYVLVRTHGAVRVARREQASKAGEREHNQFHEAVVASHNAGLARARQSTPDRGSAAGPPRDRRCFIASHLYGETHPSTDQLRAWRDRVLRRRWWGRCAIAVYYGIAPVWVRVLRTVPALERPTFLLVEAVRRAVVGGRLRFPSPIRGDDLEQA